MRYVRRMTSEKRNQTFVLSIFYVVQIGIHGNIIKLNCLKYRRALFLKLPIKVHNYNVTNWIFLQILEIWNQLTSIQFQYVIQTISWR